MDGFLCAMTPAPRRTDSRRGEGAFLACSFWLADAYVMLGRTDEAWALFRAAARRPQRPRSASEEYDPRAGRQLGNFPQAFSLMALVNTALGLARTSKPEERAPATAERRDRDPATRRPDQSE